MATKTQTNEQTENTTKKTETNKTAIMTFDNMTEETQMQQLERVANEKKPSIDGTFLFQELKRQGINRIPSEELQDTALNARKEFAEGGLRLLRGKQLIIGTYNKAIEEKYTPIEARKIVIILITQNGRLLSDRTVRRYLPQEAKDESKTTETNKEIAAKPKTQEQQEGLTEIYLPPKAVKEIAAFAAKNEACRMFLHGKAYMKVKPAVETETVSKKSGQQVTQKVKESTK